MDQPLSSNGQPEQSDLQIAREIDEIGRLLSGARDFFQTAPQLRAEIAEERKALNLLRQEIRQVCARNAAMAERATAAERACANHLEKVDAIDRTVKARIREASETLQLLRQVGGVEGLTRLRDEIHQLMELSRSGHEKLTTGLSGAEKALAEAHGLLTRLGGLERLAKGLERIDSLEERTQQQEKELKVVEGKLERRTAILLLVGITCVVLTILFMTVCCLIFARAGKTMRGQPSIDPPAREVTCCTTPPRVALATSASPRSGRLVFKGPVCRVLQRSI
jgi:hypothetical protein